MLFIEPKEVETMAVPARRLRHFGEGVYAQVNT